MAPRRSNAGPGHRRLIVTADDFGRSASINQAVIRAHREGILTAASLMVNEPACEEAVALARENPTLGVGLHLSLLCGHSALPPAQIPGLTNADGEFSGNPAGVGCRYFFQRSLREPLRREIHAQFERFRATRLPLDHVNGHLHLHLHPTVFRILTADAAQLGIKRLRLTFDPFRLNLHLASGRLANRALHAIIFHLLSARARSALARLGLRHTNAVFGLLQNGRVDEAYVTRLLPQLPAGDSELYSHPSLDEFRNEFDALISPRVREQVHQLGIKLIRYQDL
ncbi:MAG TPA: hopanoid biosynthesis-associated protein HpnK [Candidatus Paceibacterota bacterium]|nr:hopanoid biosynthesis-associated protein HpnK [Verrucomicrobiota bacterium]HSA10798.1 hopanoid biosynthesis-associated protein HpnK [Candidatus Paceibacterota bacterium]